MAFAASGRGEFDGAGRLKRVTHLSDFTQVDRTFDLEGRVAELRQLAEDPNDPLASLRLNRARDVLQTVVHRAGLAPLIFMSEDYDVEARWIIGHTVVSVTFSDAIRGYVFDRETEQIVDRLALDDGRQDIVPGWAIADFLSRWNSDS